MSLLSQPTLQLSNADGTVAAFADAYFYLTGTTTPTPVYSDAGLITEHSIPVSADDKGVFPPIFFDQNILMRVIVVVQDGDPLFDATFMDVDPVNEALLIGAANIEDGAIEEKLGYVPVNPDTAVFTAPARLNFTPTPADGLNQDDVGFRGVRPNIKNVNYTLVLDDSARCLIKDDTSTPTWTIPPNSDVGFPLGHWFEVYIGNTGSVTLARGTGVHLTVAGDADFTDANVVLPAGYRGRCQQMEQDEWVISEVPKFSLSANGYYVHPNGMIEQWGFEASAITGDSDVTVTFPLPFPNACFSLVGNLRVADGSGGNDIWANVKGAPTTTQGVFTTSNAGGGAFSASGVYWQAKGH